jgi:hypothetical protein
MNGELLIKATGLSPKTSTKGASSYLVDRFGGARPDVSSILSYSDPTQGHIGSRFTGRAIDGGLRLGCACDRRYAANSSQAKAWPPPARTPLCRTAISGFPTANQKPLVATPTTRSWERQRCQNLHMARKATSGNGQRDACPLVIPRASVSVSLPASALTGRRASHGSPWRMDSNSPKSGQPSSVG